MLPQGTKVSWAMMLLPRHAMVSARIVAESATPLRVLVPGQFADMLVFVALDQRTHDLHQRGERMRLIFTDPIDQRIEQRDEPIILALGMRNEEQWR